MNIDVTFADTQHADWLISHDRHVAAHWVTRCLANGEYVIALAARQPVGFLRYSWFWGTIPYMDMILVVPEHRRRGIGRSLFRYWEAAMRQSQATILMTSSVADEPAPQAWHRGNGFRDAGIVTFGSFQPSAEKFLVKDL